MNRESHQFLLSLEESLRKREEHWRSMQHDDYQIATPVMVSLREAREAIMEVLSADPLLDEVTDPPAEREPPRDYYGKRDMLGE